jgi:uncharacterized lipoprotein YajG
MKQNLLSHGNRNRNGDSNRVILVNYILKSIHHLNLRYSITCQFGNAVITVDPNSNPSSYDQVYPNFRLDEGSYNDYPFDEYNADATAWCYFDATVANSRVS